MQSLQELKSISQLEKKKKNKKHDKILLLGKDKLNTIGVPKFKVLIDSCISHDEFVSINVLGKHNEIKKEMKNRETSVEYDM